MSLSPRRRMEDLASAGGDVNPLKSDPELQTLLKKLDQIKKYNSFQRWKSRFLERLEKFLYEEGMKPAEKAANSLESLLQRFVKSANKVQGFIEKGDLGDNKKTVKASLALSEMCNKLTIVVSEVEKLIPANAREEKKRGFTKFHLGAVLIRQGFHQYITMKAIEDALNGIGTELEHVADKQQHEMFAAYHTQVQRFCDVMADLNLYEVMLKCLEFAEAPEEEESVTEEPVTVNITIEAHDGKILRLTLDPTETIGNIKDAIAPGCQIAPEKQVLKFQGKNLKDKDKSLEELGIEDGATLTVEPFRVPITVNTMDGKQIKLMVDPSDYMSDIKRQLEPESGVAASNQRLFQGGEELVDPNKTAEEYGIKAGSVLDLEPKTIQVTVETPDGNRHTIDVKPSDTPEDIKNKMVQASGLGVPQQVLKFNGKELENGKSLKDQGVQDGSDLSIDLFKVPITVKTMDGKKIKVMIDPTDRMSEIKRQLEEESGLPAKNQKLFFKGEELTDDNKAAKDYGIKRGSELDLEPKTIKVTVEMPDGKKHEIDVVGSDTADSIKSKIAQKTGLDVPRQVLKFGGKELPSTSTKTVKDLGIQDGSSLTVDLFKIPITVKAPDDQTIDLRVEPCDSIDNIKKMLQQETGMAPKKQCLKLDDEELTKGRSTAEECGIVKGSVLTLEKHADPIIFVDIKGGTLFGVEREEVIQDQALSPLQGNKLDFSEATTDSEAKEKIMQAMKDCPRLGVATQVVVTKGEVDEYDLAEAEKVKSMWGVNLKKRVKNKKGEEFIFVDPKTGACGELSRKKYIDRNFITIVPAAEGGETLKEAEKDPQMYDKYVSHIRRIFNIKVAT